MDIERINTFIASFYTDENEDLDILKEKAHKEDVPIIRDTTCVLIKLLLKMKKPKNILEIGTAVGYSALVMARNSKSNIDTIENYPPRIEKAQENLALYDNEKRINLLCGDATEVLSKLVEQQKKYDLVFLDAAKAQYIVWLPLIKKLMNEEAILIADNIFFDGVVLESRYAIEKRDRTSHERMRDFLKAITKDVDFTTSLLPVGDGMSVSLYKSTS